MTPRAEERYYLRGQEEISQDPFGRQTQRLAEQEKRDAYHALTSNSDRTKEQWMNSARPIPIVSSGAQIFLGKTANERGSGAENLFLEAIGFLPGSGGKGLTKIKNAGEEVIEGGVKTNIKNEVKDVIPDKPKVNAPTSVIPASTGNSYEAFRSPYWTGGRTPDSQGIYHIDSKPHVPLGKTSPDRSQPLFQIRKNERDQYEMVKPGEISSFHAPLIRQNEDGTFQAVNEGLQGGGDKPPKKPSSKTPRPAASPPPSAASAGNAGASTSGASGSSTGTPRTPDPSAQGAPQVQVAGPSRPSQPGPSAVTSRPLTLAGPWKPAQHPDSLYRWDTRDPGTILRDGFEGSPAKNHYFAAFGNRTVFSAETTVGSNSFAQTANSQTPTQYRYKINATGLPTVSFKSSVEANRQGVVHALKSKKYKKYFAHFQKQPAIQQLPPAEQEAAINQRIKDMMNKDGFKNVKSDVEWRLDNAYVDVDEVHIKGPVAPSRITYTGEIFENGKFGRRPMAGANPP